MTSREREICGKLGWHHIDFNSELVELTNWCEVFLTFTVKKENFAMNVCNYFFGFDEEAYISAWIKDKDLTVAEAKKLSCNMCEMLGELKDALMPEIDADNVFTIYQTQHRDLMFEPFKVFERIPIKVARSMYEPVYMGILSDGDTLDSLYERFNINHPEDYKARSMSVSDVIVLDRCGSKTSYYVDSFGFKELPEFIEDMPKTFDIYWKDLTDEAQAELFKLLGENGNYDVFPLATLQIEA